MNKADMINTLEERPIVAAIKNDEQLKKCIESDCKIIFVLYGSINTIADIVSRLKEAGKTVFVHIDLLDGLSPREATVEFIAKQVRPCGIISTKLPLIKCARSYGLVTIMRVFIIDSIAMQNIEKTYSEEAIDFIEILPGLMPKIIKKIKSKTKKPVIAGGLISEKSDIVTALGAGAIAISSTNSDVWFM
ncbi:MAG: glycerol-3-phosphate responsive antiterminator [Eubacterium sp.]